MVIARNNAGSVAHNDDGRAESAQDREGGLERVLTAEDRDPGIGGRILRLDGALIDTVHPAAQAYALASDLVYVSRFGPRSEEPNQGLGCGNCRFATAAPGWRYDCFHWSRGLGLEHGERKGLTALQWCRHHELRPGLRNLEAQDMLLADAVAGRAATETPA